MKPILTFIFLSLIGVTAVLLLPAMHSALGANRRFLASVSPRLGSSPAPRAETLPTAHFYQLAGTKQTQPAPTQASIPALSQALAPPRVEAMNVLDVAPSPPPEKEPVVETNEKDELPLLPVEAAVSDFMADAQNASYPIDPGTWKEEGVNEQGSHVIDYKSNGREVTLWLNEQGAVKIDEVEWPGQGTDTSRDHAKITRWRNPETGALETMEYERGKIHSKLKLKDDRPSLVFWNGDRNPKVLYLDKIRSR